jgi:predicted Zn-dependent protease
VNRRFLLSLTMLAGLALGGATLSGCTTNPATGEQSFTAFMSPSEERAVGAKEHPKLVKAFGGKYRDASLTNYLDGLGALLQSTSEQRTPPFTFTLLDSPVINAFAVPGGYVYITRGLMALANDEAELAGVVAHEIGHVTARHTAERVSRGMLANLGAALLGAVIGQPMVSDAAQLAAGAYIQGYSRDQEFEADQLGVRYLTRAGFDPQAMASFLGDMGAEHQLALKIAGKEGRDAAGGLFSSHPRTADRVEKAAARARAGAGTSLARDRDIYLNQIDGMVYGDSPEQGFIRGREFDHAGLKFRFTAPPGFRLQNSEAAVFGEHSGGALLRFDGGQPKDASQSMETYLTREWAANLRFSDVESITINGMEAATGSGTISGDQGQRDVRLVAIRFAADQVFRFLFITPPDQTARFSEDFRRTTFSFSRLSDAEADALKPRRVRIVSVESGDTPETMAGRMAFDDFQLERFRVLNGLKPGQGLAPGQRVKIVSE